MRIKRSERVKFCYFWVFFLGGLLSCEGQGGGDGGKVVDAARGQIGETVIYDPAYVGLEYPGGDVARERGVCTDVVIRALREAFRLDLQREVHEDMRANFGVSVIWGLRRPDKNIDHRRVQI